MATPRTLARLDALIWTLIFGGLLTLVLGIATHGEAVVAGWSLSVLGAIAAEIYGEAPKPKRRASRRSA